MIAAAGLGILLSAFFVDGVFSLAAENMDLRAVLYFAAALYLLRRRRWNPILVMVLCGTAEVLVTVLLPLFP